MGFILFTFYTVHAICESLLWSLPFVFCICNARIYMYTGKVSCKWVRTWCNNLGRSCIFHESVRLHIMYITPRTLNILIYCSRATYVIITVQIFSIMLCCTCWICVHRTFPYNIYNRENHNHKKNTQCKVHPVIPQIKACILCSIRLCNMCYSETRFNVKLVKIYFLYSSV